MLKMLIAYGADGNVLATLDHMVAKAGGEVVGLVDFEAIEEAGGEMTSVWNVDGAAGSKTWPEWLGGQAHDFRVVLAGPPGQKRIAVLVHKRSGRRRERGQVEAAIADRVREAGDRPADIRDLVGGPGRPLVLDQDGRTVGRSLESSTPESLPVIARGDRGKVPGR